MKPTILFPALIIGKKSIDRINYRYLICDKRYINSAFRDVLIVDREGGGFDIERVEKDSGLDILYSLKLVGLMVRVKPILSSPPWQISISDLKNKLIEIVDKYPGNFSSLSNKNSLINEINKRSDYKGLIGIF